MDSGSSGWAAELALGGVAIAAILAIIFLATSLINNKGGDHGSHACTNGQIMWSADDAATALGRLKARLVKDTDVVTMQNTYYTKLSRSDKDATESDLIYNEYNGHLGFCSCVDKQSKRRVASGYLCESSLVPEDCVEMMQSEHAMLVDKTGAVAGQWGTLPVVTTTPRVCGCAPGYGWDDTPNKCIKGAVSCKATEGNPLEICSVDRDAPVNDWKERFGCCCIGCGERETG